MTVLKKYTSLIILALLTAAFVALFLSVSPSDIVRWVGVENTYLVIFLFAVVGGLSTVTGVSFFTAIATFAAGGANPFILGLAGGLGIFISDSIFFNLLYYGKRLLSEKWEGRVGRFSVWGRKFPEWGILAGTYLYLSFTPLPNDLLMAVLVALGVKYRTVAPIIFLGSITVATLVAYLAASGVDLF